MLGCGTKARRNCISQLVTEGYISVHEDGTVILHDPYEVYDAKRIEVLNEIRDEWSERQAVMLVNDDDELTREKALLEKRIDNSIKEFKLEAEAPKAKPAKQEPSAPKVDAIIEAWNRCKPESYSNLRTLSVKQKESISKHLRNLGMTPGNTEELICGVCAGLKKSQFWMQTVHKSGRNFNSVFGYGSPQDTKMKNIENLYMQGQEDAEEIETDHKPSFSNEVQELIDTYKYINLNYTNAKAREDSKETQRWENHLNDVINQLKDMNLTIEELI